MDVRLLLRLLRRELCAYPGQALLTLLGIALGVAVVVGIELASDSAQRAFNISNDLVMGRTTHVVVGSGDGVPLAALGALRALPFAPFAAPVVQTTGRVMLSANAKSAPQANLTSSSDSTTTPISTGRTITILGVDPLSEQGFRAYNAAVRAAPTEVDASPGPTPEATQPGAALGLLSTWSGALMARSLAADMGIVVGEHFWVRAGAGRGRAFELTLVGFLKPQTGDGAAPGLGALAIVDITTAQRLSGRAGWVTRIDLRLDINAPGEEERVRRAIPDGVRLESAGSLASARREMTRGFETNLAMLGLLSLLVGGLLIFNSTSFAVARRRETLATLRALGLTCSQMMLLLLGEAFFIGTAGALVGLMLGWGLGTQLVALVARTMSDLYFASEVVSIALERQTLIRALVLGAASSILCAAWPAWHASRTIPHVGQQGRTQENSIRRLVPWMALGGCIALAGGFALTGVGDAASTRGFWLGYLALFLAIFGCGLLVPVVVATLLSSPWVQRVAQRHPVANMSVGGVSAGLATTSVAVIAFMIALATTVGVSVMVDSFRGSVERWLAGSLRATYYVNAGAANALERLDETTVQAIEAITGVEHVSRALWTVVNGEDENVRLLALVPTPQSFSGFQLLHSVGPSGYSRFARGDGVLVSEPFAFRHGLALESTVRLRSNQGPVNLPVVGVFRDYRSEAGFVVMARPAFNAHWDVPGFTGLGVYVHGGRASSPLRAALDAHLPARALVRESATLREQSIRIFDRTFAVTRVLRWLTGVVAFVAVIGALLALELTRSRDRAVLRALGMTRVEVLVAVEFEALIHGALAGALALPVGWVLSWFLVEIINQRSFGWSMSLAFDPALIPQTILTGVIAAGCAGVYPAWRAAQSYPGSALRAE
jgi:putative ABC transport system permease protein